MPNAVTGLGLLGVGIMLVVAVGTLAYQLFSQEQETPHRQNQHEYNTWRVQDPPTFSEGYDTPQPSNRKKKHKNSESTDLCPICKEALFDTTQLKCQHTFHHKCISEWFHLSWNSDWGTSTCPVCRSTFRAPDIM